MSTADATLMSPLQSALWIFLCEHFMGKENATPRRAIFARFRLLNPRWETATDRKLRETKSELVKIFKKAICSSPSRGYYVARTMAEKSEALNYLDSVLTEVGTLRRDLAEADPLERQERLL